MCFINVSIFFNGSEIELFIFIAHNYTFHYSQLSLAASLPSNSNEIKDSTTKGMKPLGTDSDQKGQEMEPNDNDDDDTDLDDLIAEFFRKIEMEFADEDFLKEPKSEQTRPMSAHKVTSSS